MIRFPSYCLSPLLVVLTSTINTGYLGAQSIEIAQNPPDSQLPPFD